MPPVWTAKSGTIRKRVSLLTHAQPVPLRDTSTSENSTDELGKLPLATDAKCLTIPSSQSPLDEDLDEAPRREDVGLQGSLANGVLIDLCNPIDSSAVMMNHYFVVICQVISNFDSSANPFRTEVSSMLNKSRLLYYCVLGLSAAHLHQNDTGQVSISLQYQTEAISNLSEQLAETSVIKSKEPDTKRVESSGTHIAKSHTVKDDVLLGAILLGMTSVSPHSYNCVADSEA